MRRLVGSGIYVTKTSSDHGREKGFTGSPKWRRRRRGGRAICRRLYASSISEFPIPFIAGAGAVSASNTGGRANLGPAMEHAEVWGKPPGERNGDSHGSIGEQMEYIYTIMIICYFTAIGIMN